jgi:flagellin
MRINHNISALNASNRLKANNNAISKNLAKLSSGYRINSAADDAAGLAVSEKMRAQINGLNQAEDNAQNGISLVQTAEGGLNETESILQRMNTLAVESANGTYQDGTDRNNLQKEVTALKSEVDRISTSTNFNGINLLDGSLSGKTDSTPDIVVSSTIGSGAITSTTANKGSYVTAALDNAGLDEVDDANTYKITYSDGSGNQHTSSVTLTMTKVGATSGPTYGILQSADSTPYTDAVVTDGGYSAASLGNAVKDELEKDETFSSLFDVNVNASTGALTFASKTAGSDGAKVTDYQEINYDKTNDVSTVVQKALASSADGTDAASGLDISKLQIYNGTNADAAVFTVAGQKFAFADTPAHALTLSSDVNYIIAPDITTVSDTTANTAAKNMSDLIDQKTGLSSSVGAANADTTISFQSNTSDNAKLTFQIGSDNKDDQRVSLSVDNMSTTGLKIQNISVATQDDAKAAIDTIKAAINTVSATRSDLGALQNRLEHTTNNLSTMSENLTSAESTIRDVDMSSEMVDLTKNQILAQAATSMLAQANAQPQSVLSLLKG